MTNTQRAVMQQALEALEWVVEQAGGPNCEHEAYVCFCKENKAINTLRKALAVVNLSEFGRIKTEKRPPFGSKRKAAMAVYVPPFRFGHGYIYDSQNKMAADDAQVEGAVASRVRGWGRLGYMPNGAELQDEIGQMIADALNAYYASPAEVPLLTEDQYQSEFEAFVNAELGDVAVTDQGRYISPKIQNYWRIWQTAIQKAGIK